jgi:hypothetical protein
VNNVLASAGLLLLATLAGPAAAQSELDPAGAALADSASAAMVSAPAAVDTATQVGLDPVADPALLAAASADTAALARAEMAARDEEVDIWATGVSPTAAVLMTPIFPGWGQLYTDSSWRAAFAFGAEMFYVANLLQSDRKARRIRTHAETLENGQRRDFYDALAEEYWERMRDFVWWSGGVLLIIALDAYVGANLFRFEEDPLPVPDRWDDHFGAGAPEPPGGGVAPTVVVFRWRTAF